MLLNLHFYQTSVNEIVDSLHRFYLWLISQCIQSPNTNCHFRIWQLFPFFFNLRVTKLNFYEECYIRLNSKTVSFLIITACWFSLSFVQTHKQQHTMPIFDAHVFKETRFPLSLVLAVWFKTRVIDILASSNKLNKFLQLLRFFQGRCWAIVDRKAPIFIPCKIKVGEFENFLLELDKFLSTKDCALANTFCLSHCSVQGRIRW